MLLSIHSCAVCLVVSWTPFSIDGCIARDTTLLQSSKVTAALSPALPWLLLGHLQGFMHNGVHLMLQCFTSGRAATTTCGGDIVTFDPANFRLLTIVMMLARESLGTRL